MGSCTPQGATLDARARADELNAFIRDPDVRAVVATLGGYTTNGVLDLLDWDAFRADPIVVLGYSDLTALLLAVVAQGECVAHHGPTLLPELAEFPKPLDYTRDHLVRAVTDPQPMGLLEPPTARTEEFLPWDEADDRPRRAQPADGWYPLVKGEAVGPLLGGNLDTLGVLVGTPYLPSFEGAVFLWETANDSLPLVERALTHLESSGALDGIVGMVVGRAFRAGTEGEAGLRDFVLRRFERAGIPVLAGVDVGHGDPMLTLPLGAEVRLDATHATLEVRGTGVR